MIKEFGRDRSWPIGRGVPSYANTEEKQENNQENCSPGRVQHQKSPEFKSVTLLTLVADIAGGKEAEGV